MFCGRKECSGCKFFKRDGCVTVPECAYKDLKEKLNKAIECLRFYADPDCSAREKNIGEVAYKALQEIEE